MKIIPQPKNFSYGKKAVLKNQYTVNTDSPSEVNNIIEILGFYPEFIFSKNTAENAADISIMRDKSLAESEYLLNCSEDFIDISYSDSTGLFYALVSLSQLIYGSFLQTARISDRPDYKYRGIMLDTARHYIPIEKIKAIIRSMAFYKLNFLHLHLTDDQGWRVEIKAYPLLAKNGSIRNGTQIKKNGKCDTKKYGKGLYYTQKELSELVAYAAEYHINVIPEIDMPGHLLAAISIMPELSCESKAVDVRREWGVEDTIACVGKNKIYEFVENIISELSLVFPCEYFHIGGDEVPKIKWKTCTDCQTKMKRLGLKDENELQGYFYIEVNKILQKYGKKPMIWDEKLGTELPENTLLQLWRSELKDNQCADYIEKGGQIVVSYGPYFYFDYDYSQTPLKKTYSYTTADIKINPELEKGILGIEGTVWTEWIRDTEKLDFNLYPRMQALSEKCWNKSFLDYYDFEDRLKEHFLYLNENNIDFSPLNICNQKFISKLKVFWEKRKDDDGYAELRSSKK